MSNQDSGFSRSDVMYPAVVGNGEMSGSMVPAQPYAPPTMMPPGGFAPRGPEIINGGFNQTWFINCLRRKWLSALLLGSLIAIMTFGMLLWLFPESHLVTAYLSVKALEPESLLENNQRVNTKEYEIFASTPVALLKIHVVQ
jgi:hypothetical protein